MFDYTKQPGLTRTRYYSPDPKNALVSVFTPFYNAGKYFEQTFNSVMNQTFPWFEWIIVDDGSTDKDSLDVLAKIETQDRRITVIHQANGGLSNARNVGVAHTHCELVVPLDADDVLAPQFLECCYHTMLHNPEAAWCYTSSYGFQAQEYIWKYPFDAEKLKTYNFLNYIGMIRKKDILEIGGWKVEKWSYYEDWRFWLEMLSHGKMPVHINTCLFWYRRLDTGMLATINKDPERVAFCNSIIEAAAANVNSTEIRYIEYPVKFSRNQYEMPSFKKEERVLEENIDSPVVLWLIPWMEMGGADKFNLDAIAGLSARGYKNAIITTQAGENTWRQKFEEYTDEIFCLPDFLDPVHYLDFIASYIQTRCVKVLMCTNSYDGYYMLPWLRQHFPDLVITDYVHMEEWYWRKGGYARTSGFVSGVVDKTWVCNSQTKKVIIDTFGRDKDSVDCLYIGVDDTEFHSLHVAPGYLRKQLNLGEDRPIVLFPCRIHPQKRPFMLLDIAEGVRARIPEVAFVIVGDGDQLEELKQRIQERQLSQTIYSIGRSEHMKECYRDSALTLICSLKEGLALTAYESCAMGVPVVSSDVGGQRDLIDEQVGALIPMTQDEASDIDARSFAPQEVSAYVEAITKILRSPNLQKKLGKQARERIEKSFSINKMAEKLDAELTYLCTDIDAIEKRKAAAALFNTYPKLTAELYDVYQLWKSKEAECEDIWQARCWFQGQVASFSDAAGWKRELDEIHNMTSWKVVQKYRNFMDNTALGKNVSKVLHKIWHVAKKGDK